MPATDDDSQALVMRVPGTQMLEMQASETVEFECSSSLQGQRDLAGKHAGFRSMALSDLRRRWSNGV